MLPDRRSSLFSSLAVFDEASWEGVQRLASDEQDEQGEERWRGGGIDGEEEG